MSVMRIHAPSELTATRELRAMMQGRVVSRGDDDYARTRQIWNGAVEKLPALFAVCETSADVQAAVRAARRHGLPLSVRGGGHDWAGRALRDDGLVIDLTGMRDVAVDPRALVATLAGGAWAKDVAVAAGAHGLVAALGNCGTVGMAGLTLGGGYGPLSGTCGLAADNLLGAEIVLADGRRVTTGPDVEPDLYWALRGGGGNFGVVTSLRVRLRPARNMLAGSIIYNWNEAGAVLRRYAAFAATAPDELGVAVGVMSGPDGEPVIMVVPLWNGERRQGERAMEDVQAFGTPQSAQVGPAILRDLFTEDRGGYFEDVALLDLLVTGKLGRAADALREAEGWKWTKAHLDFPHAHGLRRTYPHPVELSAEDQAALDAAQSEFNSLTGQHETAEELPDDVDARFGELEAEIERLEAKRQAYDPDYIVRGGAFVILNHDGTVRVERGFIRTEDEKPQPETEPAGDASESADAGRSDGRSAEDGDGDADQSSSDEEENDSPLSDILVRDLTAHRTLGLRLNLSEQPEVAVVTVTHALAAQIFYLGAEAHVVDIRPVNTVLASHADGIKDTPAGKAWADRHANWARQMPRDVTNLWRFVSELDHDSRMALLAHCVGLTVNAVKLPWERKPRALATANQLAEAVSLDMTGYWRPTVRTYFGRITKARILEAVREGVSHEAADRMADMKKPDMAEAAEQLLAATDWLPVLMRTPRAAQEPAEHQQADAVTKTNPDAYSVAAE